MVECKTDEVERGGVCVKRYPHLIIEGVATQMTTFDMVVTWRESPGSKVHQTCFSYGVNPLGKKRLLEIDNISAPSTLSHDFNVALATTALRFKEQEEKKGQGG